VNSHISLGRLVGATALIVGLAASLLLSPLAVDPADAAITRVATVTKVIDGDTIAVRYPDGNTDIVRLMGADTPEVGTSTRADMCGSREASAYTKSLLIAGDRKVTLSTDVAGAMAPDGQRILRRISAVRGGVRKDLTSELLKRGLAFFMPNVKQPTNETTYHLHADTAARNKVGIFKGDKCGTAPQWGPRLQLDLQWNNDSARSVVEGRRGDPKLQEHVRITNLGPGNIDITGWIIRTGALRAERIDAPAAGGSRIIAPGETMTIYQGKGRDIRLHRYLDYAGLMWVDIDPWAPAPQYKGGEGAYLLDPAGDVRAWQMYGCVYSCSSTPAKGKLKVSLVDWDMDGADGVGHNSEYVKVKNVSGDDVNAGRTVVQIDSFSVELQPQLILKPGEEITVYSGQPWARGHDPRTEYFLSATYGPLSQSSSSDGDRVLLRSYDGRRVHCGFYGNPAKSTSGCVQVPTTR